MGVETSEPPLCQRRPLAEHDLLRRVLQALTIFKEELAHVSATVEDKEAAERRG